MLNWFSPGERHRETGARTSGARHVFPFLNFILPGVKNDPIA